MHVRIGIDDFGQPAADLQHHILFAHAARAACTGILATVACIDGYNDIAPTRRGSGGRRGPDRWSRPDRWRRGPNSLLRTHGLQVNDQPIPTLPIGSQQKAARLHGPRQIENNAHRTILTVGGANIPHDPGGRQCRTGTGEHAALFDVDDDAVGVRQGEKLVFGGLADVERDTRFVRRGGYTHTLDLYRSRVSQSGDDECDASENTVSR